MMGTTEPTVDQFREPERQDPHVEVDRFHDYLPPIMLSDDYIREVNASFPAQEYPLESGDTIARHQYLRLRAFTYDYLNRLLP